MNSNDTLEKLQNIIDGYTDAVKAELDSRWNAWQINIAKTEMYEAIGGLMAQQITLATQLAYSPHIWNGHIAPIILRAMVDAYISLAWIFQDPLDRAQKYILYGLGQEKLNLEHRKAMLVEEGHDIANDPVVQATESWINSQQYVFLTEVNVGSWSGKSTREMAEEAGCTDLYTYAYTPFSSAAHSMWNHISKYNLIACDNPLHGAHKVPVISGAAQIDPDYLYRAAKYVDKTFRLFDEKTAVKVNVKSALETLVELLQTLQNDHIKDTED